jgi:hypothetical protein
MDEKGASLLSVSSIVCRPLDGANSRIVVVGAPLTTYLEVVGIDIYPNKQGGCQYS